MAIWRTPDGMQVEAVVVDDKPLLRVSRRVEGKTFFRGYVANVDELQQHGVDLAELKEHPAA
ncbi:hypothetical protein [Nonomuraea typhae]|uniref:hypothetical protein n=1 Tax=Nonomuraea typhae TaxID=2603600 RepID=UPI0012FBD7B2|nr:hypothetical protein [Nonomuraea typhae]